MYKINEQSDSEVVVTQYPEGIAPYDDDAPMWLLSQKGYIYPIHTMIHTIDISILNKEFEWACIVFNTCGIDSYDGNLLHISISNMTSHFDIAQKVNNLYIIAIEHEMKNTEHSCHILHNIFSKIAYAYHININNIPYNDYMNDKMFMLCLCIFKNKGLKL